MIKWKDEVGEARPVSGYGTVYYRDGGECYGAFDEFSWDHRGGKDDIVGYCRTPMPGAPSAGIIQPDGWIPWSGGECPVAKGTLVKVRLRNGAEPEANAEYWIWPYTTDSRRGGDIVAYRVVADADGWISWNGGKRPVSADTVVDYLLRHKSTPHMGRRAGGLYWENLGSAADIVKYRVAKTAAPAASAATVGLPADAAARKAIPVYSGFIAYFPDAIVAVAELSRKGNDQHNPGKPLHWDRSKSGDELDAQMRHIIDGVRTEEDTDGVLHATKNAWRAMANLQKVLEKRKTAK